MVKEGQLGPGIYIFRRFSVYTLAVDQIHIETSNDKRVSVSNIPTSPMTRLSQHRSYASLAPTLKALCKDGRDAQILAGMLATKLPRQPPNFKRP